MKELNQQELADFIGTTLCMVQTNFPQVKARALRNGYLITKRGKGINSIYEVEKTEPKQVDKKYFSRNTKHYWEYDLPNEVWTTVFCNNNYEVSNVGRVRDKRDLSLRKGTQNNKGYIQVSLDDKNYALHRLVALSFNNIVDPENYVIDHIDGNRSNNNLNNLRVVSQIENHAFMMINRKELNKELTRLLNNHSYDEVLQMLKKLY